MANTTPTVTSTSQKPVRGRRAASVPRGVVYLYRKLQRIKDTPHRLALGIACGVLASFSPFFGLHFVVAGLCAWAIRGNVIASLIATVFNNPLTFLLIAYVSMTMGAWLLGGDVAHAIIGLPEKLMAPGQALYAAATGTPGPTISAAFGAFFSDVFVPYLVGGVLAGLACGAVVYTLGRVLIARWQHRRRRILAARAKAFAARLRRAAAPAASAL